jgi:2-oxoglutarate ferredoxin oxidoreductase subunit alpha
LFGRNGDSPLVVLAPRTPADAFRTAYEAARIAVTQMVPVILLSDSYIANGAEPWRIPDPDMLPPFPQRPLPDPATFQPYARDPETLARPWVAPGTPGYAHRIGGIEKEDVTGNISYDPHNHERMTDLRREKVERARRLLQPAVAEGDPDGVLVIGWGSTYGAIRAAVERVREQGARIGHVHLRALNPFPAGLAEIVARYDRVLVPELNDGQLCAVLRARLLTDAMPFGKIQGQPFKVAELERAILRVAAGLDPREETP